MVEDEVQTESIDSEKPKQERDLPLGSEIISKAAAAIELRKESILLFITSVTGIFLVLLTAFMASINLIYGAVVGGLTASFFGYMMYRAIMKIKYLNKTYNLKKK